MVVYSICLKKYVYKDIAQYSMFRFICIRLSHILFFYRERTSTCVPGPMMVLLLLGDEVNMKERAKCAGRLYSGRGDHWRHRRSVLSCWLCPY